MLREIELSKVRWGHMSWNQRKKTVRLFIPHSKMDQQELGIARRLQCCGESPCWKGCAWYLVQTMLKRRGRAAIPPEEFLFPNDRGEKPSKSDMVASWRSLFDTEVAGHSARRSGAMAYVRKGMVDLAYLGRWKSSVVLTYAEEALETTLANRGRGPAAEVGVPAPKTPSSILVEAVAKGPTEIGGALPAGGLLGGRVGLACAVECLRSLRIKLIDKRNNAVG